MQLALLVILGTSPALASGDFHAPDVPALPAYQAAETPPEVLQLVDELQRIHFPTDSAELGPSGKQVLRNVAEVMRAHPHLRLEVQGHTDARGPESYNLQLGLRRARAVESYLESRGIAEDRVRVVSRGEYDPLVPGSGKRVWAMNRRAEFRILWEAEAARVQTPGGLVRASGPSLPDQAAGRVRGPSTHARRSSSA